MYFDIDGSLLIGDTGKPKAALANGAFERALRRCRFERLICVGNFVDAARTASKINSDYDIHGAIFRICAGVFEDEEWFRAATSLTDDSYYRAAGVDLSVDWWYLDDLAKYYFSAAGRQDVFEVNAGVRIFIPSADGDGEDVINWIDRIDRSTTV